MQLSKINNSILFFSIFFLISCTLDTNNEIVNTLIEKKDIPLEKKDKTIQETKEKNNEEDRKKEKILVKKNSKKLPFYLVGEPYFIEGIEHFPKENYLYSEMGLASFYDKELHNKRTANNELNKVTELYARHKTLPLPSVVKITNLENGVSVIARVNDRSNNNSTIIEVSRKIALLLGFYKPRLAKVRVDILSDSSKQLKTVTNSINNPDFESTIEAAPTERVIVTDLGEILNEDIVYTKDYEQPIELGFENVLENDLFVKIGDFKSYENLQNLIKTLNKKYKTTTQKEGDGYILFFGPMTNKEADKLFHILVGKGYKNSEIVID